MAQFDLPYYLDYLSPALLRRLEEDSIPHPSIQGLTISKGIAQAFPHIETTQALSLVCVVYNKVKGHLNQILNQRGIDRKFLDAATQSAVHLNENIDFLSPDYQTALGKKDQRGRVVAGPYPPGNDYHRAVHDDTTNQVTIPEFLEGEQITLFGPPDTKKMSINAMNALHRRLPNEPEIVDRLVKSSKQVPRWGADNEDSQTPIMSSFLMACENLIECFDGSISFSDPRRGKEYHLEKEGLSKPIKRIPGLALPDGNHLHEGNPLPLHLYDFVLHLFHNWHREEALVFYIPKLENEEEARYLKDLIQTTEKLIQDAHPEYVLGTVKLFIVFESPRSIFRIREIAYELKPHFVGGSLGWHDFLASTARLFKGDANYRIPVKADPNIVINHIKESHMILTNALKPIGAIRIGGMYGTLYEDGNQTSFEVCMVGFIKDVVTQLKRGLNGFWVAHPNFIRYGIAIVEAFRQRERNPNNDSLIALIKKLVPNVIEQAPLLAFVFGQDVEGLEESSPLYLRGVLAADITESDVISNSDPIEVKYNLFQAVQYLTAWLMGNGCVALPALAKTATGEDVFVRVMDDLATTERSRWELWAEINHGRIDKNTFQRLLEGELSFIRKGVDTPTKRVQIPWSGEANKWYPVAINILNELVLSDNPPEFVTELLMPFTFDFVRESDDPWGVVSEM